VRTAAHLAGSTSSLRSLHNITELDKLSRFACDAGTDPRSLGSLQLRSLSTPKREEEEEQKEEVDMADRICYMCSR
jgi:hypothetical protein